MAAGPGDCAPCHAQRVRNQSATPHANSLKPYTGEHFDGRKLRERSGTSYRYSGDRVTLTDGAATLTAPVAWAFGAGTQAVTPLIERDGKWVEHRLSWYRNGDRLSLTPGHEPDPPVDLEESLGVVQTERNATRCFQCHQTGSMPGVYCQACHGAGEAHRGAPSKANIRRDRRVALCAACHRSPDATFVSPTPELEDARSIRFAPVGFQASRCFQKSRDFTCVSCHDPHGEAARPPVNAVCRSCHRTFTKPSHPRSAECTACHMKSSSPVMGLRFTDHRIRVYLGAD